jgi:hypothetical protein
MVSDYPLSTEGVFNFHIGRSDNDACSDVDCGCVMFIAI